MNDRAQKKMASTELYNRINYKNTPQTFFFITNYTSHFVVCIPSLSLISVDFLPLSTSKSCEGILVIQHFFIIFLVYKFKKHMIKCVKTCQRKKKLDQSPFVVYSPLYQLTAIRTRDEICNETLTADFGVISKVE